MFLINNQNILRLAYRLVFSNCTSESSLGIIVVSEVVCERLTEHKKVYLAINVATLPTKEPSKYRSEGSGTKEGSDKVGRT